jgi:MFS superfamily sulfate permease-like transporter
MNLFEKILIAVVLAFLASVVDWQKDKTSLRAAWQQNFLKYIAIVFAVVFFQIFPPVLFAIAIGCLVYFFWTLIVNAVKHW